MSSLPPLVDKALADCDYDLVAMEAEGRMRARIRGGVADKMRLRVIPEGTLLAVRDVGVADRIGPRRGRVN